MQSDAGGTLIVYNGEVFNHPELRAELARDGINLETTSDTEVVHRLLERDGLAALDKLNGQFAFAWWEPGPRRLTLVRDRFGIHPLHWTLLDDGTIVFGSEAKALFASGEVSAEPDLGGIDDVFTTWAPRAPRSAFRGVNMLPPGELIVWEGGKIVAQRTWWKPDYTPRTEEAGDLEPIMRSSVELRLRADVPVGTYLSGGLDSSLTTALAKQASDHQLRTFSVAFKDPHYDERAHQHEVAEKLGTDHHVVDVGPEEIAGAFPDVVWHAETPLIRTAPVPLYLLAKATREQGITVVATGEGADELYWGYDLFKEVVARNAAMANPDDAVEIFSELYPYFEATGAARGPAWAKFFLEAGPADDPLFSHQTRVAATAGVKAFYADDVTQLTAAEDRLEGLRNSLPPEFAAWSPLEKAAYLEVTTLLGPYLLGPQSDRVAMAHGVEAPLPVPRSPDLRALGAPAARWEAAGAPRQDRGARPRPHGAARRHRRADEAAVPSPAGGALLRGQPAGVGRRASLPGDARRDGALRPSEGRWSRAAVPRGPGDRLPRGHGPRRGSVHAGVA